MTNRSAREITTYPAIVGQVLAQLRREAGVNQAHLARAVGVTQSAWSRIERGDVAITVEQLAVAARLLGTTPRDVLAYAQSTQEAAERRGVEVEPIRMPDAVANGLILLGAAALTVLVVQAIKNDRRSR